MNTFNNEKKRLEELSDWYLKSELDFDDRLIEFRYQTINQFFKVPLGLELGSAHGQMTRFLVKHFDSLTIVEGSKKLLSSIPQYPNLTKVHSLFEEYEPAQKFNTVIMEHILEHIENPINLLQQAKKWLAPKGVIIIGVPNGKSIHRLVAVKMGLLKDSCDLNERDHKLGHRRVYTHETLRKDIEKSGLAILTMGGVFFKPLSNKQIQDNWTEEMIQGFYELGKDFPEYAAEIYAVCTTDD